MGQIYKTPSASRSRPGKSNPEIFRSNLYKYGKAAGTARVIPGIAGTNFANILASQRNIAYPIARFLGNYDAFRKRGEQGQMGFIQRGIARAGRIVSGSITGRAIDAAIRPLGNFGGGTFGPLASRALRVQLGKQLTKNNPIDNMVNQVTNNVSSKAEAKVNGNKINFDIRKNTTVAREAQKVLEMAYANMLAMAPDVSTGQYNVGGRMYKKNVLNEQLMNDTDAFNKMGIAYRGKSGKREYRDIFGFKTPGQARATLLASIDKDNIRPTKGRNVDAFFKGSIEVGGSIRSFPWIWAVEYGGDIPVHYPVKRKGKHALNRDSKGNAIYSERLKNISDPRQKKKIMDKFNMTNVEDDTLIPVNHYIPPAFFIHRAAEKAARNADKMVVMQQVRLTSPGSRYYDEWLKLSKRNSVMKKKPSYSDKFQTRAEKAATRLLFRELYAQDRGPGSNQFSNLEAAIPGPRVELAHGGFYSKELQEAIGINVVPEDFRFSFAFYTKKTDTAPVLKKALDVYIRKGGFSSSYRKSVIQDVSDAISQVPGRKRKSEMENMEDAARYVGLFKKYEKAQGNVTDSMGQKGRRAEYLDKVFQLSIKRSPGGRRAYVSLRRKQGSVKASKQRQIDQSKKQKLGDQIFSDLDIRDIIDELG